MDATRGGVCYGDVTCVSPPRRVSVHPVANRQLTDFVLAFRAVWTEERGLGYNAPGTGVGWGCICRRSNARTNPWSERVRSRPSCRWSLK
jgi:hypothetical protein